MSRRMAAWSMGFLFFWVPLLHFFPCSDAFLLPKDLVALSVSVCLLVLLPFLDPVPWRSPILAALGLLPAWMVLEGAFVGYSGPALSRAAIHLVLWAAPLVGLLLLGGGERPLWKMTVLVLGAGSFMALHGLFQGLGFHEADWTTRFEGRAFSTLGNPDYLGGVLVALLPMAWVLTLRSTRLESWWTLRMVTLLLFAGLLATRVRGSLVALAAAGLAVTFLLSLPRGRGLAASNKGFLWATLGVGLTGAGAFWTRHGGLAAFGVGQESFRQRWDLFQVAWAMVKDHPWTGVGLGHFALLFPRYQAKPWPDGNHPYIYSGHVHNEFLQLWVEGGLAGLLLFLWVLGTYGRAFVKAWTDLSTNGEGRAFLVGSGAGMVSLLVQSLTNFPLQVAPTALLFGLYLSVPFVLRPGTTAAGPWRPSPAARILALSFAVLTGCWGARELAASIALRNMVGETGLGNGAKASYYAGRAIALAPSDPKVWSAASRAFRLNGQGAEAEAAVQKALTLDPNDVDDRVAAADDLVTQGRAAEAVSLCRQAIAIAPNDAAAFWSLAVALFRVGDFQGAAEGFERYIALVPGDYRPYLDLGVCYRKLHEPEKAQAAWDKAKALDPSDRKLDAYLESLKHGTK